MSLRLRTTPSSKKSSTPAEISTESSSSTTSNDSINKNEPETPRSPSRPPTFSQRAISQTLTSTANLANLLPTGTLLAFQILTPIFTNNGACDSATAPMTSVLLALLAVSCFLGSFTDSVRSPTDGQVYYGFATLKGMFLFDCPDPVGSGLSDLSKLKLRFIDVVHAVLSVLVFVAVALRDKNVLSCFYPMPKHETQEVLDVIPVGIGLLCSFLFLAFPTRRHGIAETLEHSSSDAKDWACVRKEAFSSENNEYGHLLVSDFSDTVPTLPPENLQNFMVDPRMREAEQNGGPIANPLDGGPAPRDVANRNALAVLFESMLPWVNYGGRGDEGGNEENQVDGHEQDDD